MKFQQPNTYMVTQAREGDKEESKPATPLPLETDLLAGGTQAAEGRMQGGWWSHRGKVSLRRATGA